VSGHPKETELALLASGDCGVIERYRLRRHVDVCADCRAVLESFVEMRGAFQQEESLPDWDAMAREMRANIRLGLEAGECVKEPELKWNFRPALALASLLMLVGAGFVLREAKTPVRKISPVLASSDAGIEFRSGDTSLMLLNRDGAVADQTVNAQGEIRSRYIDEDTGAVTINNVYLQ
jgi:hypothetical protein